MFESPIDLLFYITAVPEEWEKHSYISLGGLSEKAMKQVYMEHKNIRSIYLCLDNDEPGNERCKQFVSMIPEEFCVFRLEPSQKDWNECLVAGLHVKEMAKQICLRDNRENLIPVTKMSEVDETVVQWLWYPFIPFGKVTLIQGNPGKGKTCAIVLIGHLNKSSGSQSDYRSLGSIDIAAAVRSILFVEKVEKEKEQDIRVVYQQKDSLAKKENPVAFSLGEEGLKWLGEYDISIEDLLMGKAGTKKETKLEKAQKLILELLTKRKVMCLEELEAELLAYGISSRTGRDARKQLENRLSYD